MPPRATWKGHMKLSLVSFAVRVYNATSSSHRITLNQLHRDCHQRLKQKMACPEHGDVERAEIVKGYEFEKGRYVVVDEKDLASIQLESTKTIEIIQFVEREELKPIYFNAPYYVAPDGAVAMEAFGVIREAIRASGKIGIGRFVVAGREHLVAIDAEGRGLLMTTLRSAAEVRQSEGYFEEIEEASVESSQLDLAENLIASKLAPLDTSTFKDRYQDAMLDVIKAKIAGESPAVVEAQEAPVGLNFMEALKASVAEVASVKKTTRKKPPAKSVSKTVSKKTKRKKA